MLVLIPREQMGSDDYMTPSDSQGIDNEIEKEHLLSHSGDYIHDASVEVPRRRIVSPQWIGVAVIMVLFINVSCLFVTMHQLQLTAQVLRQHISFPDNRDLPRPDPYDGV